tara:strand:- start:1030 stop:1536 length:507 start_codon:yes stop_codon:yes gene_type:complete
MLIAENLYTVDYNNIIITHSIKNNIQTNNNFYKILYSNDFVTLNGIYCYFKLQNITIDRNQQIISFSKDLNLNTINKLIEIEYTLLNQYSKNKDKSFKISEILNNNCIKYNFIEHLDYNNNLRNNKESNLLKYFQDLKKTDIELIIKISGIWESNNMNGLTFKFLSIS